jgi:hypothetical protein
VTDGGEDGVLGVGGAGGLYEIGTLQVGVHLHFVGAVAEGVGGDGFLPHEEAAVVDEGWFGAHGCAEAGGAEAGEGHAGGVN